MKNTPPTRISIVLLTRLEKKNYPIKFLHDKGIGGILSKTYIEIDICLLYKWENISKGCKMVIGMYIKGLVMWII